MRMTGNPRGALAFFLQEQLRGRGSLASWGLLGPVAQGGPGVQVFQVCAQFLFLECRLCEPSAGSPVSCDCFTRSLPEELLPSTWRNKLTIDLNPSQLCHFNKRRVAMLLILLRT